MHKGWCICHRSFGRDIGLIVHLSASTSLSPDPNSKVIVTTVEEAIKMGADAVSIHVNIGASTEPDMLRDFGQVARECNEWGMPLMVMLYPRGKDIKNNYDVDLLKQCARAGMELGADIVKTSYTGDIDTFREVVKGAIIGSHRGRTEWTPTGTSADGQGLHRVGGSGVSIGRNMFQHRNVTGITRAVTEVVLHDASWTRPEATRVIAWRSSYGYGPTAPDYEAQKLVSSALEEGMVHILLREEDQALQPRGSFEAMFIKGLMCIRGGPHRYYSGDITPEDLQRAYSLRDQVRYLLISARDWKVIP